VDSDELPKGIAVANLRISRLSAIFKVLAARSDGGERIEFVIFADGDRAFKNEVRMKAASSTNLDLVTNDTIGSNFDVISYFGLGGDDCGGMNHGKEV